MTQSSRHIIFAHLACFVFIGAFGIVLYLLRSALPASSLSSAADLGINLLFALLLGMAGLVLASYLTLRRKGLSEEGAVRNALGALTNQEDEIRRLSRVVEQTADSVVITDRKGIIEYVNPSFERQTGYTFEEARGKTPSILKSGRHDPSFYSELWATIMAGQPFSGIIVNRMKDGALFYEEKTITPLRNASGEITHFVATAKDITVRRKAEEEEHKRAARFRVIYEQASFGIAQIDMDGRLAMCNKTWCSILGYLEDEIKGLSIRQIACAGTVDALWEAFGALTAGLRDTHSADLECHRKDGSPLQIQLTLSLVRGQEGEPLFVVALLQDVTQRRQQEELLRKAQVELEQRVSARTIELRRTNYALLTEVSERTYAEAELKAVTAALPDAAFISEESGLITTVLTSAGPMPGRKPETTISRNILDLLPPDTAEVFARALKETLASGKSQVLEYSLSHQGRTFWYETRTAPLLLSGGGRRTVVFLVRDISGRKEGEQRLKSALIELERSNRDLEQFASIASHDLQEPLRMVSSYVQLLAQNYQGKLGSEADEFIGYAVDGAKRMSTLISDLLSYARVGREMRSFAPVDVKKTVTDVMHTLKLTIRDSGATIICGELPTVHGDGLQLGQLFQNLIANAIKFHGDQQPSIEISAKPDEMPGIWVFALSDNGIGIAPENFGRIFEIFQRLHSRRKYSGSGIGLAICKRIVELHGGRIWLESSPGAGTTFFFTLPAAHQT